MVEQQVHAARTARGRSQRIVDARYEPEINVTLISLDNEEVVEIEL
jgi:hypothetical protein